jgi:hypothetical protein
MHASCIFSTGDCPEPGQRIASLRLPSSGEPASTVSSERCVRSMSSCSQKLRLISFRLFICSISSAGQGAVSLHCAGILRFSFAHIELPAGSLDITSAMQLSTTRRFSVFILSKALRECLLQNFINSSQLQNAVLFRVRVGDQAVVLRNILTILSLKCWNGTGGNGV